MEKVKVKSEMKQRDSQHMSKAKKSKKSKKAKKGLYYCRGGYYSGLGKFWIKRIFIFRKETSSSEAFIFDVMVVQ